MHAVVRLLILLSLALALATSQAKTLRWGAKGDAQSMDPTRSTRG
jgi:hypothetical protein